MKEFCLDFFALRVQEPVGAAINLQKKTNRNWNMKPLWVKKTLLLPISSVIKVFLGDNLGISEFFVSCRLLFFTVESFKSIGDKKSNFQVHLRNSLTTEQISISATFWKIDCSTSAFSYSQGKNLWSGSIKVNSV